jgi:predicted nucleic acid-binding protein
MVILDTNIIIDHLRSSGSRRSALLEISESYPKTILAVSLVSVQELYEGQSTLHSEKEKDLLATLSPLKLLPYTYDIAKLAGAIARDSKRSIELADAAIAATAILNNAQLYTKNLKDFQEIPNLELFSL